MNIGFAQGRASPYTSRGHRRVAKVPIHGDDYVLYGYDVDLKWFAKWSRKQCECTVQTLGPAREDFRDVGVPNRIAS